MRGGVLNCLIYERQYCLSYKPLLTQRSNSKLLTTIATTNIQFIELSAIVDKNKWVRVCACAHNWMRYWPARAWQSESTASACKIKKTEQSAITIKGANNNDYCKNQQIIFYSPISKTKRAELIVKVFHYSWWRISEWPALAQYIYYICTCVKR